MNTNDRESTLYSRRDFGKLALAGVGGASSLFLAPGFAGSLPLSAAAKINSTFGGVQIGAITYSFNRIATAGTADDIIKAMVTLGLGEAELMNNHCELLAGAPTGRPAGAAAGGGGGARAGAGPAAGAAAGAGQPGVPVPGAPASGRVAAGGGAPGAAPGADAAAGRRGGGARGPAAPPTPEQLAATEELRKWRVSANENTFKPVRKKFEDAGIELRLLCYNMPSSMTDEILEYGFVMAKALGVKAISTTTQVSMAQRIGAFADRHKMLVGFHGHDQVDRPDEVSTPETFKAVMAASKYHRINLDIGHFTAANFDPVGFLAENHANITNLHLKDRKKDHGANVVWGQGDTPIKQVLQLLKKNKWDIPANIEFETPGLDPLVDMAHSIQYCKDALA